VRPDTKISHSLATWTFFPFRCLRALKTWSFGSRPSETTDSPLLRWTRQLHSMMPKGGKFFQINPPASQARNLPRVIGRWFFQVFWRKRLSQNPAISWHSTCSPPSAPNFFFLNEPMGEGRSPQLTSFVLFLFFRRSSLSRPQIWIDEGVSNARAARPALRRRVLPFLLVWRRSRHNCSPSSSAYFFISSPSLTRQGKAPGRSPLLDVNSAE